MNSLNRFLTTTRTVVKDLSDVEPTKKEFETARAIAKEVKLPTGLQFLKSCPDEEIYYIPDDLIPVSLSGNVDFLDGEGFFIKEISSDETKEAALKSLKSKKNSDHERWLDSAFQDRSTTLLGVSRENSDEIEGFIAYRRTLCVELHDELFPVLSYSLALDAVYVHPDCQGLNLSTALRRAMMEDAFVDVPYIAQTYRELQKKYDLMLNYRVHSEPITEGGYQFTEALTENLNELVEEHHTSEEIMDFHDKDHQRAVEAAYY